MLKMLNMIDIGERAGSGIPNIFSVWKQQGWSEPTILVSSEPDRSTLVLPLFKSDDKKVTIKSDDKKVTIKASVQKALIIEHLTNQGKCSVSQLTQVLGVKSTRVKQLLYELVSEGIVVPEGGNRNRTYRLKS